MNSTSIWHDMFATEIPFWDKVLRTVIVYAAIAVLLRVAGKRDLAQFNTFDLVVMLLLSNVVQNAVIGPDNSVTGGLIGAVVLVAVNSVVVRASAMSDWFARVFEGTPTVLARNGAYDRRALRRLGLRTADVDQSVKHQGGDSVLDTSQVTLEPGGSVLVRLRDGEEGANKDDVAALRAQLDRIERRLAELAR